MTACQCLTGALAIHPQAGWSSVLKNAGLALAVVAGMAQICTSAIYLSMHQCNLFSIDTKKPPKRLGEGHKKSPLGAGLGVLDSSGYETESEI